jgi:NDP-sugar pyrophosphorylase family protein
LEKPTAEEIENITTQTVNAGTYVLEPEVLDLVPKGENFSFEYGVFPELLRREERFFAFVTDSYWLDVGTPSRYLQAQMDIINRKVAGFETLDDRGQSEIALTAEVSDNSFLGNGCQIGRGANIQNAVIGERVSIGENAFIENSVIGSGTRIDDNARISGAIIGTGCRVESFSTIGAETVLGDGSILTAYSKV